jgi:threonylcarbamoyladenosine tRNA methylthiotransferase MtaB
VVEPDQPADVVVINTCTVTENGDADTRRLINRMRRLNIDSRIALVGCQSQVQSKQLAQIPGVHWVIGTAAKMELAQILERGSSAGPLIIVPEIEAASFKIAVAGVDLKHTRANFKIQDGCDFFCSYCEIPYARGSARSRDFDDLLREAAELAIAGHKELVLTGINVGLYRHNGRTLIDVVRALQTIPELLRIRISSIEATTIPLELIQCMTQGKLCRFLHLPLQSASNAILQRMQRKYLLAEYDAFVREALSLAPDLCLGTDVLVGFPGESDTHFNETLEYLQRSAHSYFHVFSYSDRINNKSRHYPDKVPVPVIEKRSRLLRELSARKRNAFMERCIGRTEKVLFEQKKNGYWTGVTDTYIRVRVPSEQNLHNELLAVTLTDIDNQNMMGRLA